MTSVRSLEQQEAYRNNNLPRRDVCHSDMRKSHCQRTKGTCDKMATHRAFGIFSANVSQTQRTSSCSSHKATQQRNDWGKETARKTDAYLTTPKGDRAPSRSQTRSIPRVLALERYAFPENTLKVRANTPPHLIKNSLPHMDLAVNPSKHDSVELPAMQRQKLFCSL